MNERSEKLSAVLDDYDRSDEQQSLLNDVMHDVNQQYTLRRYQLIGDVMRNDVPERIQLDFADRVRAEIAQLPAHSAATHDAESKDSTPSWLWSFMFKPIAGLAVAATVAVVVVSNIQLQTTDQTADDQLATITPSEAKVEQLASMPVLNNARRVATGQPAAYQEPGMKWKVRRDATAMQNKLNTYLINHNEYSNPMQGIIPQVRVVGFDAQQ
ncbi:MAG: sigma-E factor negative regulatory protein [Gammaproteobacteria bacterium]|nr:sigma-E factor negative regulatory protein [Gammaproteobacteria bacterium]